jgi:hypothetical protein
MQVTLMYHRHAGVAAVHAALATAAELRECHSMRVAVGAVSTEAVAVALMPSVGPSVSLFCSWFMG